MCVKGGGEDAAWLCKRICAHSDARSDRYALRIDLRCREPSGSTRSARVFSCVFMGSFKYKRQCSSVGVCRVGPQDWPERSCTVHGYTSVNVTGQWLQRPAGS